MDRDAINRVNALAVGYITQCKNQPVDWNVAKVRKWLKDNNMLAIPYDKGTGFCIMPVDIYNQKLSDIVNGGQFAKDLASIQLDEDDRLISLDVTSLFTNVPVEESIQLCANLLYESDKVPPVDKETFITMMPMACVNVLLSTPMGFYRQMDGVTWAHPLGRN